MAADWQIDMNCQAPAPKLLDPRTSNSRSTPPRGCPLTGWDFVMGAAVRRFGGGEGRGAERRIPSLQFSPRLCLAGREGSATGAPKLEEPGGFDPLRLLQVRGRAGGRTQRFCRPQCEIISAVKRQRAKMHRNCRNRRGLHDQPRVHAGAPPGCHRGNTVGARAEGHSRFDIGCGGD